MDRLSWLDKLGNGKAEDPARNVDRGRLPLERLRGTPVNICHMPHGDNIGLRDPSGHGRGTGVLHSLQLSCRVFDARPYWSIGYWLLAITH
jgi:hypothetical protein